MAEPHEIRPHEITQIIGAGDLVFDIGAHVGDKAQWFVDRGAKVICVEPLPLLVDMIRQRFQATDQVVVIPKGISDKPGRMVMEVNSHAPALSTFAPHWKEGRFSSYIWDLKAEFEMTTLDELIAAYGPAKYCKIDVEGFEFKAISGLSSKRIECISYEFLGDQVAESFEVLGLLLNLGYSAFNFSAGEVDRFSLEQWLPFYEFGLALTEAAELDQDIWGDIYAK
jgi:FkbM family methyltransferase